MANIKKALPDIQEIVDDTVIDKTSNDDLLGKLMNRLDSMENELSQVKIENEILKTDIENGKPKVISRHAKYDGPRTFSYKMMDGKPIVSFKTLSNRVVKNQFGGTTVDQKLELHYSDNTSEEVDYISFAQSYQYSEKQFPKQIIERDGQKFYVFVKDWQEFQISQQFIN